MGKGGVTKKLEDAVSALDKNQIKKALYLTGQEKLQRQHGYVEEAARTCLSNKKNKEACEMAIRQAKDKITDTITAPMEDTSLENLEDYISPEPKQMEPSDPRPEMTDEELFEACPECHIATAASAFADICQDYPETQACKLISEKLTNATTEPVDWIKAMIETAEQTEGEPKKQMTTALGDLKDYLERRDSPWLKELDKVG